MGKLEFHRGKYFPFIPQSRQIGISQPIVCPHHASWFDHCLHKAPKTLCRSIHHMLEANPSDSPRSFILNTDDDQCFPFCPSTTLTTFFTSTDIGFVDLNAPRELVSPRSHHSSSEFLQPLPRGLIAAWFNDSSKAKSVSTVLLGGNVPHRTKPQTQWLTGAMENRAGGYGSLNATFSATPQPTVRPPRSIRSTPGAEKPLRPTQSDQVFKTGFLRRKPLLEFCQRPRIVFHGQTLHLVATGVNPIPRYMQYIIIKSRFQQVQ